MGYQIDPNRPTDEELRRVIGEQLTKAAAALRADAGSGAVVVPVHDVRKRLKKARSALRLGRADLGRSVRRQANDELRRSARALSVQRDVDAHVEALDALVGHVRAGREGPAGDAGTGDVEETDVGSSDVGSSEVGATDGGEPGLPGSVTRSAQLDRAFADVRAALVARAEGQRDREPLHRSTVLGVARSIEQTTAWLGRVPERETGWDALAEGFAREYRRGRNAFEHLGVEPTAEALHEWRKRAKDLWYHQRLLRQLWPEAQRPFTAAAHDLADRLGEDHDLALLVAQLTGDGSTAIRSDAPATAGALDGVVGPEVVGAEAVALVAAGAQQRRSQLQVETRRLGALLYADRPGGFRDRHGAWWAAASRHADSPADRPPADDNA